MPRDAEPSSAPHATIELRFLSGSGLGQCHYATGDCVSVGTDQACDVHVAAGDCDAHQRCCVQILTSSSGWYLNNLGSSTVAVNHTLVTGETRLKSGDVIRLSLAGPDMMFSVVADRDRRVSASEPAADRDRRPVVTGPVVTGPVVTGPVVTGPVVTGPVVTGPVVTGPVVTGPMVTGPMVTGPMVTGPMAADRNRPTLVSEPDVPEVQLVEPDKSRTLLYVGAGVVALALISLLIAVLALIVWIMRPQGEVATKDPAADSVADTVMSVRSIPGQAVDEGRRWELDLSEYVSPARPAAYQYRPVGSLPPGLQLDGQTGKVSWTPSESQGPGSYDVEFEVRSKAAGTAVTTAFTLQVREVNTPPRLQSIADKTFTLGTSAALEIQVVAVDDDQPQQPIKFRLGEQAPPGMVVDPDTGLVRWAPQAEHAGQTYPAEILVFDPDTAEAPQKVQFRVTVTSPTAMPEPDAKVPAQTQLADSLYLLVIEEPTSGTVFPFAVAFAVRDDLLLTSGAVVQELAKVRDKGRVVFAINCVSQDQADLAALYLHPDYTRLQHRPEEQIYSDIGAVQLASGKHAVAPLAAAADATVFEQGAPLECVMPAFEAEPLTKFDNIKPSNHAAKIYMVTRGGDTNAPPESRPRLLALVGTLPKNAYGSPIINAQGQVVALYVEKADLANNKSLASLADRYHYALCLDAVAGLLEGDALAAWRLEPKKAGNGAPPEKQ